MYALGWTQHSIGVQIIRTAAMLQLLLGNVGRPGGGVNALRGHSNIQGATDMGGDVRHPARVSQDAELEPPRPGDVPRDEHALDAEQDGLGVDELLDQLPQVHGLAAQGACTERQATKENEFGYAWLPKVDGNYSWTYMFDDMYRGSSKRAGGEEPAPEGLISFGMNPVGTGPNSPKMIAALSKLKWLVVVENYENETAAFWKAPKELGGPDAAKIQTEVFLLPAANFAEKDGSFTNSARWVQWKWKALDPPGQAKADQEIIARIFLAVQ